MTTIVTRLATIAAIAACGGRSPKQPDPAPTPVETDVDRFRAACDGGEFDACSDVGLLYDGGKGVVKDPAQANALYRKGCDGGSMRGCYNLAISLYEGSGGPRDPVTAAALLDRACAADYAVACFDLGALYDFGGLVSGPDPQRAVGFYEKACRSDDDEAIRSSCFNLADLYAHGHGVAVSLERAAELYRRGCDHGDGKNCTALALATAKGNGVPKDEPQAAALLQRTCDASWRAACYHLGLFYRDGIGVAADAVRSTALIEGACQSGLPAACDVVRGANP